LKRQPAKKKFVFGKDEYSAAHMTRSLDRFLAFIRGRPSAQDLKTFIETHFLVYRSIGGKGAGKVLFTGYFEPILDGRLTRDSVYRFPALGLPTDMLRVDLARFSDRFKGEAPLVGRVTHPGRVGPYYDRAQIEDKGVLKDKAAPLAWFKDRVDLFFLQIQGSGKVHLGDGDVINLQYAAQNGRPYRSIGALLIQRKKISREEMSMQKIREYLDAHPGEVREILNYNPSYVFFQIGKGGPYGSLNVELTPGRSLAADRRIFPKGALALIRAEAPLVGGDGKVEGWAPFNRFVLIQDTGGAIKGPGRADLFWGSGEYAEIAAGHMKQEGELYFLIMKPE
ncbi:MAG: murein transglycosylase, partial [Desulfobacterales bacterium]|nr:murein transglycosylase [Desulfobacterales bacterium]